MFRTTAKRDELVQNSSCHEVPSEVFASNATDPPHWTQTSHFGAFHTIWVHSGPFGYRTNLDAQWGKVVQKLVPRSRIGIFHNKRTGSTPLDPKLTFSGPFGCLTKLGEQGAKVVQKFMPRSRVGIFRNERT